MESQDVLKIKGGTPLEGEVSVFGAKNAVSKILVATLLTDKECILHNVSNVVDTELMINVIQSLGGEVETSGRTIATTAETVHDMDNSKFQEVVGKSRVPILLCGPLLARLGHAVIPALGGCVIGNRPVDFHITALKKLGAEIEEKENGIYFKADRLKGCPIKLEYPSVGATEQVLLSAVLAEGITELSNAAIEPEILDLVEVLKKMGANIVLNDRTFVITGVEKLNGFEHSAIPDRLEVASWACAAAATNGKILVRHANAEHMRSFLDIYEKAGGGYAVHDEGMSFWRADDKLMPVKVETDVYPGFATDWQQPFTVLLTQAEGESIVHETVYEQRFGYTEALNKMGADITLEKGCQGTLCRYNGEYLHTARVKGPTKLKAAEIEVPDLRGGFSYIVAALMAEGTTTVTNVRLLSRGYEDFISKLKSLGAAFED